MMLRSIFDAFLRASRRSRIRAAALPAARGTASRSISHGAPRRRGQESGYAFLFVLGLMLVMIASSVMVIQKGATIRRRRIEQETIWRGNQYARAIRLYYHKTGHYPQTLDDLEKGMPELHFLRQAYKNPTNRRRRLLALHLRQFRRTNYRQHQIRQSPADGADGCQWRPASHAARSARPTGSARRPGLDPRQLQSRRKFAAAAEQHSRPQR